MSADTEQTGITDGGEWWEPDTIRRRLPNGLRDTQERALICAVRNPDASLCSIAEATATSVEVVRNGLESLAYDLVSGSSSKEWVDSRNGEAREAETFDELTEKQQAVIDYLARHPEFDYAARSSRELRAAMENYLDDMPDMHYTYPKNVATGNYERLIEARRSALRAAGTELEGEADYEDDVSDDHGMTPREWLLRAGISELPESNLDSLEEHAEALDDETRLELAFENGEADEDDPEVDRSEYLAPLSCPKCSLESNGSLVCPSCGADKRYDEDRPPREAYYGEAVGVDEFEFGVIYLGVVSGVESYGLFVTLAGQSGHRTEVSGLLHHSNMPVSTPTDILDGVNEGDAVPVVVVGYEGEGDERKLELGWPTQGRVENHLDDEADEPDTEFTTAGDLDADAQDDESEQDAAQDDADTDEGESAGEDDGALGALLERVERIETWIESHPDDEAGEALAADLRELRETVEELEAELEQTRSSHAAEIGNRADAKAVSELGSRVQELEREHAADDLRDVSSRVNELDGDLNSLESALDSIGSNTAGAHSRLDHHDDTLENVRDRLDELEHRVGGAEAVHGDMLENLVERVESLESGESDPVGDATDPDYAYVLRTLKDALEDGHEFVSVERDEGRAKTGGEWGNTVELSVKLHKSD